MRWAVVVCTRPKEGGVCNKPAAIRLNTKEGGKNLLLIQNKRKFFDLTSVAGEIFGDIRSVE